MLLVTRNVRHAVALIAVAVAAACGPPERVITEPIDVAIGPHRAVDILFVIDDSCSMTTEQDRLARAIPAFATALASGEGGMPDVHIGVVTTDVGTLGVPGAPQCPLTGGGDLVKGDPDVPTSCPWILGHYISDVDDGRGGRSRNYSGSLADALACTTAVGLTGCGFEQPLEAMRLALADNPHNAGFLRDDAALLVIVVADEDDCSAADPVMYGPDNPVIGPASFRCFEKAVACNEGRDADLRVPGVKTGCHVDDTQDYLHDVHEYVEFLRGLKRDPRTVTVAGLIGKADPVVVSTDTFASLYLGSACSYAMADGTVDNVNPAIRLNALLAGFPQGDNFHSICSADFSPAMTAIAGLVQTVSDACFDAPLAEPVSCELSLVTDVVTPLDACDGHGSPRPCWRLVEEPSCADTPTGLAIKVEAVSALPPGARLRGRCAIEPFGP